MKDFKTQEFVPPKIWIKYKEASIYKINPKILSIAETIRKYFNQPVTINNWHVAIKDWNGDILKQIEDYEQLNKVSLFKNRGYRPDDYDNKASQSLHFFGMAEDLDVHGYEAEEIRQVIFKNYKKFPFIRRMEHIDTKTGKPINWVHLDIKETNRTDIVLFDV